MSRIRWIGSRRSAAFALAACAALGAALVPAAGFAREQELRAFLKILAGGVAAKCKANAQDKLMIQFNGPPTVKTAGAAALIQLLGEELAREKIALAERAKYALRGEFHFTESPRSVRVEVKIVDAFGRKAFDEQWEGNMAVTEEDWANLFGMSIDLRGKKEDEERDQAGRDALEKPAVYIQDGSKAVVAEKSPFQAQVVVKGAARRLTVRDGAAQVTLELGEEYQLRLTNASDREAAAAVAVDGVDVFHFSEERKFQESTDPESGAPTKIDVGPKFHYYVLAPGATLTVPGWFINSRSAKAFRITPLADSAAAKVGHTSDVGTLTASFFSCWREGEEKIAAEREGTPGQTRWNYITRETANADGSRIVSLLPVAQYTAIGTGFGGEVRVDAQGVKRHIGRLQCAVTIRYDKPKP